MVICLDLFFLLLRALCARMLVLVAKLRLQLIRCVHMLVLRDVHFIVVVCLLFFSGTVLHWKDKVRLRHVATDRYLCVNKDGNVSLSKDGVDTGCILMLNSPHDEKHKVICT